MSFLRQLALIGMFALLTAGNARGEDRYFMIVYGCQRPVLNLARYSHVWATFVRVSGEGTDPKRLQAEAVTISWLSSDLAVDPKKVRAQPGVNLGLHETIEWCERNRVEIAQFGPYSIQPELFELAKERKTKLESGAIRYRASDVLNDPRTESVSNCTYAVLGVDGTDRLFRPLTFTWGFKAAAFAARRLQRWYANDDEAHLWVTELIGVKNYPVRRVGIISSYRDD